MFASPGRRVEAMPTGRAGIRWKYGWRHELYLRRMWSFLRRQLNYFLIGFVVGFVIYLFLRYDADDILLGIVIGAVTGLALSIALFALERRFPDRGPASLD